MSLSHNKISLLVANRQRRVYKPVIIKSKLVCLPKKDANLLILYLHIYSYVNLANAFAKGRKLWSLWEFLTFLEAQIFE